MSDAEIRLMVERYGERRSLMVAAYLAGAGVTGDRLARVLEVKRA